MASKTLDNTQISYAVIEKELQAICFGFICLTTPHAQQVSIGYWGAICFGCKRFHEYIYGNDITIQKTTHHWFLL